MVRLTQRLVTTRRLTWSQASLSDNTDAKLVYDWLAKGGGKVKANLDNSPPCRKEVTNRRQSRHKLADVTVQTPKVIMSSYQR